VKSLTDAGTSIVSTLQAISDKKRLFDRSSRRTWLLLKALENLPLNRALALAVAAERFLCGDETELIREAAVRNR